MSYGKKVCHTNFGTCPYKLLSGVKFYITGSFINRFIALLVVFNKKVMGCGHGYHTILPIFTLSQKVSKWFILCKIGWYILNDLGKLYIKSFRGRGYLHIFKPQVPLAFAICCTNLHFGLMAFCKIGSGPITSIYELVSPFSEK